MTARRGWMVVGLCTVLFACTPSGSGPGPRTDQPLQEPAPAESFVAVTVTAPGGGDRGVAVEPIVSGWGSAGLVPVGGPIPYWVAGTVALTSAVDMSGVRLRKIEVFDAESASLGVAEAELELDRAGPSPKDFSSQGTTPFDGTLSAGQRAVVRFHGRMEDGFADRTSAPHAFQLILVDDAGAIIRVSAPIGPQWPTR